MKFIKISLPALLIVTIFTFSQCKKNKDEEPQLPPETTTGAMTFGCKVNGKVFVPKDARGKPGLFVQYVNLGAGAGGGWYLNIPATNWQPSTPEGVNINTDSLRLVEGNTYLLKYRKKGFAGAFYQIGLVYEINESILGELKITKSDTINRILSGQFFFTGIDFSTGKNVNITDGRFDVRY